MYISSFSSSKDDILNKSITALVNNDTVQSFKQAYDSTSDDKPILLAENMLDKSGNPRPGEGWVIGPEGYWQVRIGAETELLRGAGSSMEDAATPANMPACESVCVGVASAWAVHSGDDVSAQVKNTTDLMGTSDNEGVKAAGEVIKRYNLPYNIYNAGSQLPDIQKECEKDCGQSPVDFQLTNDAQVND